MYSEDLFDDEKLSKKTSFEEKSTERGQDGLYRVDLEKVSSENKARGYRAKLRFLPNFTNNHEYMKAYAGDKYNEDMEVASGPAHFEKVTHYLNIQNEAMSHVRGYYDDPTNINPKTMKPHSTDKYGPLATTYFQLSKSDNAILKEKANQIKYQKKYFSYVLILEDEQQPELVGKIMVFSYGKQIKDIIVSEKEGEATGVPCDVFSPKTGKDFVLLAKENTFTNQDGKEVTAPDYTKSRFYDETTTIPIAKEEDGSYKFIRVPMEDGKFKKEHQEKIVNMLLSRDIDLESFAGKAWNEEMQKKVSEAIDFLTGKASSKTFSSSSSNDSTKPEEFSFDDVDDGGDSDELESFDDDEVTVGDDDFDELDF